MPPRSQRSANISAQPCPLEELTQEAAPKYFVFCMRHIMCSPQMWGSLQPYPSTLELLSWGQNSHKNAAWHGHAQPRISRGWLKPGSIFVLPGPCWQSQVKNSANPYTVPPSRPVARFKCVLVKNVLEKIIIWLFSSKFTVIKPREMLLPHLNSCQSRTKGTCIFLFMVSAWGHLITP